MSDHGIDACEGRTYSEGASTRTQKLDLDVPYGKELVAEQGRVPWLIMHAAVMVSSLVISSSGGRADERYRGQHRRACAIFFRTAHEARRTARNLGSSMMCTSISSWAPTPCTSARELVSSFSEQTRNGERAFRVEGERVASAQWAPAPAVQPTRSVSETVWKPQGLIMISTEALCQMWAEFVGEAAFWPAPHPS